MRTILIRTAVALLVLPPLWFFAAKWMAGQIDRIDTVRVATIPASPVGWSGIWLEFGAKAGPFDGPKDGWNGPDLSLGNYSLTLDGPPPDYQPIVKIAVDPSNRLIATAHGHSFVLGVLAGTRPYLDGTIPIYAAEPGDKASLTLERSLLSWPTPFETNWMTGYVHSWYRYFTYRLTWEKASGERLEMVWRFQQGYNNRDGWSGPGGTGDTIGPIRVNLTPPR